MTTRVATGPPRQRSGGGRRPRLLIFVVAYDAEKTIEAVLSRIPAELNEAYETEVLTIDDSSRDSTFERAELVSRSETLPFPLHVLFNPVNQGYGGNQKIGFQFAIDRDFDVVALLHGDGQYAPEVLPELVAPVARGDADAVMGSRMLTEGAARHGGMPLYKFVGNKILTRFQNAVLGSSLSEFHSGYRVYSVDALRRIPFDLNTNDFHFDTQILIQLFRAGFRVDEVPIPTYYGDEICHVDGMKYASDVVKTTLNARVQSLGLLYHPRYDAEEQDGHDWYEPKLDYPSPHRYALEVVKPGSRVLDLGCAGGFVGAELRRRGCEVVGVDLAPPAEGVELDEFHLWDLDQGLPPLEVASFDYVLMLDVVEHLRRPEAFLRELYRAVSLSAGTKLVLSTGNVAFVLTRLLLLAGQFNYGRRGILDMTHTRLFTFGTVRRLLDGAGFRVLEMRGVPGPFPLAFGPGPIGDALLAANLYALRFSKRLFAYQSFVVAEPRPSLERLLRDAHSSAAARSRELDADA
jgi:2-polyprenyl-3-methyl-5-hydroxy-6-metoxy-1,4-benzoquinol methylase